MPIFELFANSLSSNGDASEDLAAMPAPSLGATAGLSPSSSTNTAPATPLLVALSRSEVAWVIHDAKVAVWATKAAKLDFPRTTRPRRPSTVERPVSIGPLAQSMPAEPLSSSEPAPAMSLGRRLFSSFVPRRRLVKSSTTTDMHKDKRL